MVWFERAGGCCLNRFTEEVGRHGQVVDDDEATEGEEHGRGQGTAQCIIADAGVTVEQEGEDGS